MREPRAAEDLEELRYTKLPGNPIDNEFEISTPILCHASPDAGWPTLEKFLNGVRDQLTIAIYDFSADYIADALLAAAETARAKVDLIIDPEQDANEVAIQTRLEKRLRELYASTDASTMDRRPDGLFDSAYHTKVTVRDSEAFWLSSGNWSRSSQPDVDPFGPGPVPDNLFRRSNRDWHVIVQHRELAQLFERYIKRDIELSAVKGEAERERRRTAGLAHSRTRLPRRSARGRGAGASAATRPAHLRPPRKVRPLLTPDNYVVRIKELIAGAERSLCLQFQYINPSFLEIDREFLELVKIVRDKTNSDRVTTPDHHRQAQRAARPRQAAGAWAATWRASKCRTGCITRGSSSMASASSSAVTTGRATASCATATPSSYHSRSGDRGLLRAHLHGGLGEARRPEHR